MGYNDPNNNNGRNKIHAQKNNALLRNQILSKYSLILFGGIKKII